MSESSSFETFIRFLSAEGVSQPPGMIETMHYGFALRYGGFREPSVAEEEWASLNTFAPGLTDEQLQKLLPVLDERAWEAGSHEASALAERLWERLSPSAQGAFLAGLARHLYPAPQSTDRPHEDRIERFIADRLPDASLTVHDAAEIAANAIRARKNVLLERVLGHPDFDSGGQISRARTLPDEHHFKKEISQHATRVVDVLLEAAVRCLNADAVDRLLKLGANPNLPCWNLERSFSDWFSLMSFALYSIWSSEQAGAAKRIFHLLLDHGADARGLPCESLNHPLKMALDAGQWDLADRLLDRGADFTGGLECSPESFEKDAPFVPGGLIRFHCGEEELAWVEDSIAPLLPLAKPWEVPLFHKGNGQGGWCGTFLNPLLSDARLERLRHFEKRGLPTRLTPALLISIAKGGDYAVLLYLLRDEPNLPRILFRIRRRFPDFGASGKQAWLGRPQRDRCNELTDFDPGPQTPLELPDGSRIWAFLDSIAPPNHTHGPVTEGCFWVEKITADHRRRSNRVEVRNLRRIWRMANKPGYDIDLRGMIPVVKEVDGCFFLLGVCEEAMVFASEFPEDWQPRVREWIDGPLEEIRLRVRERIDAQMAVNRILPAPVLPEHDLKPYPQEFWPYLRRLRDGIIGVTPQSCEANPDMLDLYTVWERQNKPPRDWKPDPRVAKWPLWPGIPAEMRPFFIWDDLFGKPTIRHDARNDYERAMIHQAVQWNNAQFIKAFESMEPS